MLQDLREHGRRLLEVAFTFTLILVIEWMPRQEQRWMSLVALAWILGSTFFVRENREDVELGLGGLRRSLWVVLAALVLASLEILIAHYEQTLHPLYSAGARGPRLWGYVTWAFLQQFILQEYFLLRLLRAFGKPWPAVAASAVLFSLCHAPNPILMIATLVWGLAACWLFLRYRDLYSLGFAHAVFGLTIAICIPAAVHHNMRVGLGYLRYQPHRRRVQRSQMDQMVSTEAWVMADAATRRSVRQARP